MTAHTDQTLGDVLTRLATLDVASWRGLPAGLDWRAPGAGVPATSMLGESCEPADIVNTAVTATGDAARLWIRDDAVALVDVSLGSESVAGVPEALGAPDRRFDLTYGLSMLPRGEWVYASRGLALVVQGGRVRHVLGFVPCRADEYVRRLRVSFAVHRRPLGTRTAEGDL